MKLNVGSKVKVKEYGYTGWVKEIDDKKLCPYKVQITEVDYIFTFWFSRGELELENEQVQ